MIRELTYIDKTAKIEVTNNDEHIQMMAELGKNLI